MNKLKEIRNRFALPGWLFVAAMVVYDEILLHLWSNQTITGQRLLVVTVFALAFGALLAAVTSLFSPKTAKWVAVGVSVALAILFGVEFFINDYFQNFMPLSMIKAGGAGVVGTFMPVVFELLASHIPHILALLLPIVLYVLLAGPGAWGKKMKLYLVGAVAALYALALIIINVIPGYAAGLSTAYDFDSAVRAFGLNVALPVEIYQTNAGGGKALTFETPVAVTEPPAEATEAPKVSTEPDQTEAPTEPPVVYGENVLDIDFAKLAEEEPNSNIASIHSYVAAQTPSMENEFTGLFEGKNLILISAEAFTGKVIDPELTPALYRMATEGIQFTEYYQPVWGCGTTGGEFSNVVGMAPNGGGCMMEATQQHLFLTMGNQLQKLGYSSAAYHNNDYTYYSRHETHELLGYDIYMGYGNGIEEGVTAQWPESDEEMFRFTIPQHLDSERFSLYYMSVSGHSNYGQGCNAMSRKHYDKVKDLPWGEEVKCYIAANLDLEAAMAYLIETLEEKGIADDTVVVIASDHYPYGLSDGGLVELFGQDAFNRFYRDRNQLIIWSGCLEDMDIVVDTPVYSLDILPTLSNLFGVEYDSRLLPGRDIFSDTEPLVFWKDYCWKTDKGTYDSPNRTFIPNEGVEVEEGYVDRISAKVRNIIAYSRAVQQDDYFDYIVPLLEDAGGDSAQ